MEITFGVMNITRQAAKPAFAETGPEQSANQHEQKTGENQKFSNFVHLFTQK
jgi:hypothetical protein